MKNNIIKPCDLFADLIEKQRFIKANVRKTTLEEARAIIKWLKDGKADKKERPSAFMNEEKPNV